MPPECSSFTFEPEKNLIPAPTTSADWPQFREMLAEWRDSKRRELNYDDRLYRQPEFTWAATNFLCGFVMLCDETFYDHVRGQYTLDAYLDAGERDFGGYDSIVLWHAYPRIGADLRNQFDFYREMPGGLDGLRALIARAQKRGVRVFLNFNPWDLGTRREKEPDECREIHDPTLWWPHNPYSAHDVATHVEMVHTLGVDGIFLDTLPWAPSELTAALRACGSAAIYESEMALHLANIADHHSSWAQNAKFVDAEVPGVLRNRWFERRHMMHVLARKHTDHTPELHTAWMNGTGLMLWENVFGTHVGWSERDRSLLRAVLPVLRRYAPLFTGEAWSPLIPTLHPDLYASLWEADGVRLWTLINRSQNPLEGALLEIESTTAQRTFDLISGTETNGVSSGGKIRLSGKLPPRGLGCFLAIDPKKIDSDFLAFLTQQATTHARANYDATPPALETKLRPITRTPLAKNTPERMVEIPSATLDLHITFQGRECGFYEGSMVKEPQFESNMHKSVTFVRPTTLTRFAIDRTPVTNAQFAAFLSASGYQPRHTESFLKHWTHRKIPTGFENHPVVYVDLDDARAYAQWAGKRLPTEEEWQFAAQGSDSRKWPWGAEMAAGRCNDGSSGTTTPVDAFPEGASPFGALDFCGNVWQWTESERSDGRTRFCILRGGSHYETKGSGWYIKGGPQPVDYAAKFLLMWPGLDRCSTIGFRCAVDLY